MEIDEKKIIIAETFIPESHESTDAKIRVRPIKGQGISTDLRIECPRKVREEFPLGTKFEMNVKMCQREDGSYFLYNHQNWPMDPISSN